MTLCIEPLSQFAFDRAEEISDALHALDGMIAVLERELSDAPLGAHETRINPLVGALRHYNATAKKAAQEIAISGKA